MLGKKNFFISYTHSDERWATWIAWVLEQADYGVIIQAWDFRPGANFVLEMQEAARQAERTIAVFSPAYLAASYPAPEWATAFSQDPQGAERRLIPIVVEQCDTKGLLRQVVHINLVGLDAQSAEQNLLAGLALGRAKPMTPPEFPGLVQLSASATLPVLTPQTSPLRWRSLQSAPNVTWRSDFQPYGYFSRAVLELHLVPAEPQRLEVRRLQSLSDQLAAIGRRCGLFTGSEGLDASVTDIATLVRTAQNRNRDESALLVTRVGQRGSWITLPHDTLGAVLDFTDVQPRLASLMRVLLELPLDISDRYAFAVGVGPAMLLSVGDAAVIGRRTSASMPFNGREYIRVLPDDVVEVDALRTNLDDVAVELLARLESKLGR